MKIYYDLAWQSRVVAPGQTNLAAPILFYGTTPVWEICLTENGEIPDLSGLAAWRAAVDGDFDKNTTPVCRSYSENIDISEIASGVIRVRLSARTAEFQAVLSGKKERPGYFELQGLNDDGHVEMVVHIPIRLHASVDPVDAASPDPMEVEQFVTQVEMGVMIARVADLEARLEALEAAVGTATEDMAAIIGEEA